jgi:predicted nucleic acid-binding Zn ribbon protein
MIIKTCINCNNEFESKTFGNNYCSDKCRYDYKTTKQICSCGKKYKVFKKHLEKYPEEYSKCYKCRPYQLCVVCGEKYDNKNNITCSKKCSQKLKEQIQLETTGSSHNFSKDSIYYKKSIENLQKEYGVKSNLARLDVIKKIQKTIKKKYGVDHITQSKLIKKKVRITATKNGFWMHKDYYDEFTVYRYHVKYFTNYNLKYFGNFKFEKGWKKTIGVQKNHIDHSYSVMKGFIDKIPAYIIGSIVNLELMYFRDNCSKNNKCYIEKEDLYKLYNDHIKNNKGIIFKIFDKFEIYEQNLMFKNENKKN